MQIKNFKIGNFKLYFWNFNPKSIYVQTRSASERRLRTITCVYEN